MQLGAEFTVQFEAPHVVDMRRQVWAGAVGVGPGGGALRATYEAGRSAQFQDRLGAAVLAMAGAVPDGMLVFLPSYSMLDALTMRWQARHSPTGLILPTNQLLAGRGAGDDRDGA